MHVEFDLRNCGEIEDNEEQLEVCGFPGFWLAAAGTQFPTPLLPVGHRWSVMTVMMIRMIIIVMIITVMRRWMTMIRMKYLSFFLLNQHQKARKLRRCESYL